MLLLCIAKRRNFMHQKQTEQSIKSNKSGKMDDSVNEPEQVYNKSFEHNRSKLNNPKSLT